MGQNTSNSVCKPCEDLQKTFDLCHCQQRVYNKVLRWNFVIDQILIFHHNLQINYLKILQCDFLDFCSYFVSHSWGIPMMKITGLSHLFKWENLHNWWLTKYFFAPLYTLVLCYNILHCPLSGPDLTYISLLIIFCIIEYVTNKTLDPWIILPLFFYETFLPHYTARIFFHVLWEQPQFIKKKLQWLLCVQYMKQKHLHK